MTSPTSGPTRKQLYDNVLKNISAQKIFFLLKGDTVQTCLDTAKELERLGYGLSALDLRMSGVRENLKKLKKKGERNYGVFGVATGRDARIAINAGARFIFSPHTDKQIIRRCRKEKIFHSSGALTPSEIHLCNELRSDSVSIYPCELFKDIEWINFLKESYPDTKLIPAGDFDTDKLAAYLELNTFAVAMSVDTTNPKVVESAIEKLTKLRCRF